MSSFIPSVIRTVVPYLVAWIVTGLAAIGIDDVPDEVRTWLTGVIVFVIGTVWYLVVRALERRWSWLGVLLGTPRQPVYEAKEKGVSRGA